MHIRYSMEELRFLKLSTTFSMYVTSKIWLTDGPRGLTCALIWNVPLSITLLLLATFKGTVSQKLWLFTQNIRNSELWAAANWSKCRSKIRVKLFNEMPYITFNIWLCTVVYIIRSRPESTSLEFWPSVHRGFTAA